MALSNKLAKIYGLFRDNKRTSDNASATEGKHGTEATVGKHAEEAATGEPAADSMASQDAADSTSSKFGWVDNTAISPWSAICHLTIHFSKTDKIEATGFLFSDTIVVTAAHNLRRRGKTTAPVSISIKLGKDAPNCLKGSHD